MGEAACDEIRREVETAFDELPAGRTRDEQLALADRAVTVPIYGAAESMNLATAASVCLYESAFAQRS